MRRILIIDDEPDIRELLGICVELEGWEPIEAAGGQEGLRLASQLRPDAVLLDVATRMDGPRRRSPRSDPGPRRGTSRGVPHREGRYRDPKHPGGAGRCRVPEKPFEVRRLARQVADAAGWVT